MSKCTQLKRGSCCWTFIDVEHKAFFDTVAIAPAPEALSLIKKVDPDLVKKLNLYKKINKLLEEKVTGLEAEIKGSVRNDNDKHSNQYGVE